MSEEMNHVMGDEENTDQETTDQTAQDSQESETTPKETEEQTDTAKSTPEGTVVEEEPVAEPVAHDDFDWDQGNNRELPYSQDEIDNYLKDYEATLRSLNENEMVKGKVASISGGDVVLDLSYKSDGLVALSEFRDMPDLKEGDMVEVYVEQQEDERGQLVLSRRKAKLVRAWEDIVDSYHNGTIIKGQVVSKTKGGLIVDAGGLETFLPGSQIDIKPIIDYDAYVGKTMEFKVVKINEAIKNAVVSHKALIESDLAEQRDAIISGLEKGQVLEGVVKNITDFGAFMDLGGVDGLLYITDISWGRINHPTDVLELNQQINVVVLDFDEGKKRISLGLKQLQPHPWDVLGEEVQEGSVLKGRIVNIEDYGAFLEITPGVEGLIHVSEISWSNQPVNARDYFDISQEFEAKIVTINRDDRKMSLSLKQLTKDPWSDIDSQFPINSRWTGEVKNLTPYGVFVELQEGIGGMIHISDLSWTKRFSHPSEFTKIGEKIDVVILEIDIDSRKLSLGHKQIEENPWDTFESVFPVGSYHEATIIRVEDRGAIVQLPYGLEAFSPIKHIKKEDGSNAKVDESLQFKVIEFNRDDKRILVSHTRFNEDIQRDAEDKVRTERSTQRKQTSRTVRKQQSRIEPTTLGEMDIFSQIKQQLQGKPATPPPAAAEEKPVEKEEVTPEVEETPVPVAEEAAPVVDETTAETVEETLEVSDTEVVEERASEPVAKAEAKGVAKKKAKPTPAVKSAGGDQLKKLEGIGPKIAQILNDGGIENFSALAESTPEKLREILLAAGSRYKMYDPTTWPEQAALAAEDKWDELKALQEELHGGRK